MLRLAKRIAVGLSVCGMMIPGFPALAAQPVAKPHVKQVKAPLVIDVALAEGHTLVGQVLTKDREPAANVQVSIRQGKKEIAHVRTDAQGKFSVSGVRPGVYQIVAADGVGLFRLWDGKVAPPAARKMVMVVSGAVVYRGQTAQGTTYTDQGEVLYDKNGVPYGQLRVMDDSAYCEGGWGIDPLILTTTGAAIAGVVLGAIAVDKIDDVQDDVDKIPKSP